MSIEELQDRLRSIYPADVDEPEVIAPHMTPDLLDLFDKHAEIVVPRHIEHWPGRRKLQCMKNALEYAISHPTSQVYLGWGLYIGGRGNEYRWAYHAIALEAGGLVIDSSFNPFLVMFVGVKFGAEVWAALPKNTTTPTTDLPDVLRTPVYG